ncbi:uncharacterized protein TNCV_2076001 [Trichonephila clavipes]|nr:uncharacterized protein TNCV_2076001 [Trichonephila clavipes]
MVDIRPRGPPHRSPFKKFSSASIAWCRRCGKSLVSFFASNQTWCPGWNPGDSHSGAQRNINPELRDESSFRKIPEQYFLGAENVTKFLENIDNDLTYYEIPAQLACAYLKGHLTRRALDWFDVWIIRFWMKRQRITRN